jgi:diguanylate cyclase (GGDEF)-like protein
MLVREHVMTPTLRIAIGMLSITISLVFAANSFGLIPSSEKIALDTRAAVSENLAIQLATLASVNDEAAIKDTVRSILARNREMLSIGIRGSDGRLLVDSGDHHKLWREQTNGTSTESFIQVPLLNDESPQGRIEFVFRPLHANALRLDIPREILSFVIFIGAAGFVGYYFILSRVLRELDPSGAVPDRIEAAFDTLAEGVLILDEKEQILLANRAFEGRIYGNNEPLIGIAAHDLPWAISRSTASDQLLPWQIAMRNAESVIGMPATIRSNLGEDQRLIVNATPILDHKRIVRGAIVTLDNVSALHRTNEQLSLSIDQLHLSQMKISEQNRQLQILASCDPLTGCLNRRTFFLNAEAMLRDARARQAAMSFLMLDADHFKGVNDRFGHAVGDKVLVGLVDVMKRSCGEFALVGRYGGEEFCIAVTDVDEKEIERLAEQLRKAVGDVKTWLPNGETVTISIGIASIDADCEVADLVKRADSALYTAKATGRNRFVTWKDVQLLSGAPDQLREAIRDRKLYCEFQPKVETSSRRVVGFEALVRWRSDRGDNYPTEEFIRQAVEHGLINEVTLFVLESVVQSIDRLDAAFGPETTISINVAAKLANDTDFMISFTSALKRCGLAQRIIVEMTEESLIKKGTFHAQIVPLFHDLGVQVSIDDFGTGYSSLSVLADLMADEIKIDRSLISRIHERPRNQSILRAINSLAQSLNMNIVAEGVETFEELAYLQAATTIRQVQGFYFSRPFHPDQVENVSLLFLQSGRAAPKPA